MNIRGFAQTMVAAVALAAGTAAHGEALAYNGAGGSGVRYDKYGYIIEEPARKNAGGSRVNNSPSTAAGYDSSKLQLNAAKPGHLSALLDGAATGSATRAGGMARVTLDHEARKLCFNIQLDNADKPFEARVHNAPAGQDGPAVLALLPAGGAAGTASGCVDDIDTALLRAMQDEPAAYYISVRTPAAAIRGQLH